MEKKMIKKLLIIMMIITILTADFFVLGSGLVAYAAQANNEIKGYPNIHFSTYLKEGEKETKQINKSIKDKELKLYARIGVNSDVDCLEDIQIKLKDNFKIISSNKGKIESNTVKLGYIGAGTSVELELGIEPILANKISADMLLKTNIELNAKYKHADAPEGENIQAISECSVKYLPDETTESELEAEIITNKVLSVDDKNQRVVQVLVKSRLRNNEYPVKQTLLNVTIPKLSEIEPEVSVLPLGTDATNGTTKISNIKTENGTVQITLNNEIDENNEISWNKNAYDEIVVTYIYPETVDASKIEVRANSEIKLHGLGNTYTAKHTKGIENQELNNVIIGKTEITTQEMYKGQLYANMDTKYETKTTIAITNPSIEGEVAKHEGADLFGTNEGDLPANTKYIATKINLEKLLAILGEAGNLTIKNGEATTVINKDSSTDNDGNVVINYENSSSELDITTSKPVKAGLIEINHTKAIIGNAYTREQLRTINTLKTTEAKQTVMQLKETTSKAELTIENNKTGLSTTESNDVTLGITLVTNGMQYDLYKNPKISLKFPTAVENVQLISNVNKQNADEFKVNVGAFDTTSKTMTIDLQGEQTSYPESELTQSYIQLNLNITLASLAMAQTSEIQMVYTNENATQYANGTTYGLTKQEVEISAPSQLIKMFNLSENENTSLTETIVQLIKEDEATKTFDIGISLLNNKDTDLSNVKILGKLPTAQNTVTGEDKNTLETILKGIKAENATIYYTENSNATEDIENAQNGWTTSFLANAKLYLIKVESLARGEKVAATITVQIPSEIIANAISYTQYEVIYDTAIEKNIKDNSRKIGLASSKVASIKTEITAQVGQDIVSNGDPVKEGEVIKYTVKLSNKGVNSLENVQLKLDIPEGTTYVRPIAEKVDENGETIQDSYVFVDGYYEEITDNEQLAKLTTISIPQLTGDGYAVEYEVRVNKGAENTEISNKPVITYGDTEIESTEFKNKVHTSNIRVSIENATNELMELHSGATAWYVVNVENLSNTEINDYEMNLIAKGFKLTDVKNNENISLDGEKITIGKIEGNEMISFAINGTIEGKAREINATAVVNDLYGKTYRSNYIKQILPILDMEINMSSSRNGQAVKEGDIVDFNINVKNNGEVAGMATIETIIPEVLEVQSIYIDGLLTKQCLDRNDSKTYWKNISNNIQENVNLEINQTSQIKITAKVSKVPESSYGEAVRNSATITAFNILEDTSNVVTHILKANDDIGNVISGMVWFEEIENKLSDIVVKLYDINTQSYLKNEEGDIVQTRTNFNGEYSFSNIKEGSYLVVFEYDTDMYMLANPSDNSKATIKTITNDDYIVRLAAIEITDLNGNAFEMNVGLMENTGNLSKEQQPGVEEIQKEPENSKNPTSNPSVKPENSESKEEGEKVNTISGYVWLDLNQNGQKDKAETYLQGIKVRLYDVYATDFLKDESGKIIEITTDSNGKYEIRNIVKGSYIVIFEYNTEEYKPTTKNSNIVLKHVSINGQQITAAVTDTMSVENDITNINLGLKENLMFDLELDKYISKIVVQTRKGTKTYDYEEKTLGKVEIHKTLIQGANVVLEYTIKVKNTGEIAGYARNIVDYLPSGLTFSSELNPDWYLSENNLFTKNLENTLINPGEEKEIKLVLTKTMTNKNVGLINNRAEIYEDYNKYGELDIDSITNNQSQDEDDFGTADVIIVVATGGSSGTALYFALLILNMMLIAMAIRVMFKNRFLRINTKKGRR